MSIARHTDPRALTTPATHTKAIQTKHQTPVYFPRKPNMPAWAAGTTGRPATVGPLNTQRPSKYVEIGGRAGFMPQKDTLPAYHPLISVNSPYLPEEDALTAALVSRKNRLAHRNDNRRLRQLKKERERRMFALGMRKAERETLENYVQTPYIKGRVLDHGSDVHTTKVEHLQARMARAEECGAVEAMAKLEAFLRRNRLRVSELFEFVDADTSGGIDCAEFAAALDAVNMHLTPAEARNLFEYLDRSGDGVIQPMELEAAVRVFRYLCV